METHIETQISQAMTNAKNVARKEFGENAVAEHPEIVVALFQGIAALEQAKAMEKLGQDICAAAAHARGE
jgi:hypothetical protein